MKMKTIEFTKKEKRMLKLISCLKRNKKRPVSEAQLVGVYRHFNRFQKKNRLSKKEIIEYMRDLLKRRKVMVMRTVGYGVGRMIGVGLSIIARRIAQQKQQRQREGEKI